MPPLKIRAARGTPEFKTASSLAETIWFEHYVPIVGEAQVRYMVDNFQSEHAIREQVESGYEYYILEIDGAPVGYTGFEKRGSDLFLSKIYLLRSTRGKGIGRACFDFIKERARELGAESISLTVNKKNENTWRAYEAWGSKRVGPKLGEIGNGFVMDDWEYRYQIS